MQITKMGPDAQADIGFAVFGPGPPKGDRDPPKKRVKPESAGLKDSGSVGEKASANAKASLLLRRPLNAYGLTVDQGRNAIRARRQRFPEGSHRRSATSRFGRGQESRTSRNSTASLFPTAPTARCSKRRRRTPRSGHDRRKGIAARPHDEARRCDGVRSASSRAHTGVSVDRVQEKKKLQASRRSWTQDIQIRSATISRSRYPPLDSRTIKLHLVLGGMLASIVVSCFIRNIGDFIARSRSDLDHRDVHVMKMPASPEHPYDDVALCRWRPGFSFIDGAGYRGTRDQFSFRSGEGVSTKEARRPNATKKSALAGDGDDAVAGV